METNLMLMGMSAFESYYGSDLRTDGGRWDAAQAMAQAPMQNDLNNVNDTFGTNFELNSNGGAGYWDMPLYEWGARAIWVSVGQGQIGSEFYYNALDGLVLNDGSTISRNDIMLSFDESEGGNARYLGFKNGKHHVNFNISDYEVTVTNIQAIGVHEIYGHGIKQYNSRTNHYLGYFATIDSQYWLNTTDAFKGHIVYTTWLTWSRSKSGAMPSKYMDEYYKYIKYHK